ncbi:MAG: hypothetical protein ABJQ50_02480 [Algibacter sp.]
MRETGEEIDSKIDNLFRLFMDQSSEEFYELYLETVGRYRKSVLELKSILNSTIGLINKRESKNLTSTWGKNIIYSNEVKSCLNTMYQLGLNQIQSTSKQSWIEQWKEVFDSYNKIAVISDGCKIRLALIESCAPEEIDEFTETLLKHLPISYSIDEAAQYEKEYLESYDELKKQASQKKNLWDRILDILAGGTQTTPAQMVMMNRWVNGEKGEL